MANHKPTDPLGRTHATRGVPRESLALVESLIEALAPRGHSAALAALHYSLINIFQNLGQYEDMLAEAMQTAELAEAIGDDRLLAMSLERRGTALVLLGRPSEAMPVLVDAISLLERMGNPSKLLGVLVNLGEALRMAGKMEDATHSNEQPLAAGERVGNASMTGVVLVNLGQILLTLEHRDEARERLERAEQVLATIPSASNRTAYIPAIRGQILLARGDWEMAERELLRASHLAEASANRQALEVVHIALAELALLREQSDAAIALLEPLAGRSGGYQIVIESILAWCYLQTGNNARAVELITTAVAQARRQGEILGLIDALRILEMVRKAQGQQEDAKTILEEGLGLARSLPYPYAEARILAELGRLQAALVTFQRLGAMQDIERIERALIQKA